MLGLLRQIISLNNLNQPKPKAQIATLLMLIIVAVLIFIVTTVNLGKLSLTATTLSNSADAVVLSLASRLATEANRQYEGLNQGEEDPKKWEFEKCKKGGALGKIVAAIVAVATFISAVATFGATAPVFFLVMAKAALAGAIAEGLATGGWGRGALMGASIGASVAGGGLWGATWGAGTALAPSMIGAIAGASLGAAGSLYSEAQVESGLSAAHSKIMEAIAKRFKDSYTQLRESLFFEALSQTVDDPGKVKDTEDIDGDGDTEEMVSRFLHKYYTEHLKGITLVDNTGAIKNFQSVLGAFISPDSPAREFLRWIHRKEVECAVCECAGISCNEGPVIELLRGLKDCNYNIPFWEPGPDRASLESWYACDEGCPAPPPGYDEIDFTHYEYEEFIDAVRGIMSSKPEDLDRNYAWLDLFYPSDESADTNTNTDYYSTFGVISGYMRDWQAQLDSLRSKQLPKAQLAYGNYTPNVTDEDKDAPCGKEYHPAYFELTEEERLNYSPFYPCVWKKAPDKNSQIEGAYFPNYPCRIKPADKTSLSSQLETIESFVDNLVNHIQDTYPALNPIVPPQGTVVANSLVINIIQVGPLTGDKKDPCSQEAASFDAEIEYIFYYTYDYTYACITGYDTEGNPIWGTCTATYTSDNIAVAETLSNVREIVYIPEGNPSEFLDKLGQMQATLNSISPTGTVPFATIDADADDEFEPVLSQLKEQEDTLNALREDEDIQSFYNTVRKNRLDNGGGKLWYDWTDSQGAHRVTVEIGPFKLPGIEKKKHGPKGFKWLWNKTCWRLKDYCANVSGCPKSNPTWVRIIREDPTNVEASAKKNVLGKWNPFRAGAKMEITRESSASYNINTLPRIFRRRAE